MRHQYTIRGVSPQLDARLREEAHDTGTSLNALVVDTLERTKLPREDRDDLDWFIGSRSPREDDSDNEEDAALGWLDGVPGDL